jgi:hypothetical protein
MSAIHFGVGVCSRQHLRTAFLLVIVQVLYGCAIAGGGVGIGKAHPVFLKSCPAHKGKQQDLRLDKSVRKATGREYVSIFAKLTSNSGDEGLKLFHALSVESDDALPDFKNRTRVRFDKSHGNQIIYTTDDGRAFLVYPGNPVVLRGNWLVCTATYGILNKEKEKIYFPYAKVCFRYDTLGRNPATGVRGDKWECAPAGLVKKSVVDSREGDVFNLQSMRLPHFTFSLSNKQTLSELEQQIR